MRRRIGRISAALILGAFALSSATAHGQAQPASGREDLARDKPATASTFQSDDKAALAAFDGDDETRWCASDGAVPQWLQVDLGRPETLTGCRIVWEANDAVYHYKVEGSADGKAWKPLSDQSRSEARTQQRAHAFDAKDIRHVRLTILETDSGQWASLFTFNVLGTRPAPAASKKVATKPADSGILGQIKAPAGFEVSVFASPPDVRYPTCLAASPGGDVYVGIDENGSLDAKKDRGRVVKCVDTDGDGKADKFTTFASMDSPRGVIWDAGTLYVLHPPLLSAYTDTNDDGVADRSEVLVKGIGFDLKFRGADHTTNGIRLGIDGFIYVAVGDYGFVKAEGKDGASDQLLGGGIVRVRTDGTGLEIVSRGQRNIYDVAIDPYMNLFTRDNTNDGDGWDVRLSHVIPTGHYGYPSLFKRFADEHVQPLADYGGGSPCGSLFLQEPGLPRPYGDTLYTCEWGRGAIFMHPLEAKGAGFKAGQEKFLDIPRPTDMDVDASGRIYVSSWRDGGFTFSKPDIGYVIRVVPAGLGKPAPLADLKGMSADKLVDAIASNSSVLRLATQRELLRRGVKPEVEKALVSLAGSTKALPGRVAAIFTIEQALGAKAREVLLKLAKDAPEVREFAIKALADRPADASAADVKAVAAHLGDPNPRVRLQAVIALGKLGKGDAAQAILPMTADADPLVAHASVKALVALDAAEVCLRGLADSRLAPGATQVLQALHEPKVVAGLARVADNTREEAPRRAALKALCRLYFTEAPYEQGAWWGTRPDTTGPYYKGVTWAGSETIGQVLRGALKRSDDANARWLLSELLRDKVDFEETTALAVKLAAQDSALRLAVIDLFVSRPRLTNDAIRFLDAVAGSESDHAVRNKALRGLLRHQNQPEAREAGLRGLAALAGLDDLGADLANTWLEYTKDNRHARDAATYVKLASGPDVGKGVLAYGVLLQVESNAKAPEASRDDAKGAIRAAWDQPASSARLLRAVGLARANGQVEKVRSAMANPAPDVKLAAEFAARRLGIDNDNDKPEAKAGRVKPIAATPYDQVLAVALKDKGDAGLGAQLFEKQGCINCHTINKSDPVKGPYLGDVTTKYNRSELTESILKPSARIAQGFETQKIALSSGQTYEGFVVREAGNEVELRNSSGAVTVLSKKDIDERGKSELSVMPAGLLDLLTPHDLASILAYLESLKGK